MILSKSAPQFFICGETLLKTRSAHKLFPDRISYGSPPRIVFPGGDRRIYKHFRTGANGHAAAGHSICTDSPKKSLDFVLHELDRMIVAQKTCLCKSNHGGRNME